MCLLSFLTSMHLTYKMCTDLVKSQFLIAAHCLSCHRKQTCKNSHKFANRVSAFTAFYNEENHHCPVHSFVFLSLTAFSPLPLGLYSVFLSSAQKLLLTQNFSMCHQTMLSQQLINFSINPYANFLSTSSTSLLHFFPHFA